MRARSTSRIALLLSTLLTLLASRAAAQKRVEYLQVVDQAVPSISLFSSASAISYGTPLTFTTVLAGMGSPPTGTVNFLSGSALLGSSSLNAAGKATYTAAHLPVGEDIVTALYGGDANHAPAVSPSVKIAVAGLTPSITITPSASTITTAQPLTVSATVNGGTSNPTPTGTVQLTSGNYSSSITILMTGSATIGVPAGSFAAGSDLLTVTYSPDAAGSAIYGTATYGSRVTVIQATPGFTISATPLALAPGEIAENTSIVTITPTGGFGGVVALAAAITSAPANAQNLPTLSFHSTGLVSIQNAIPSTALLTVTTIAPPLSATSRSRKPMSPGMAGGSAAVAYMLLAIAPLDRRRWTNMLGIILLCALCIFGMEGCFIVATQSIAAQAANKGTTPGTYTITIIGASGSVESTGSLSLLVE